MHAHFVGQCAHGSGSTGQQFTRVNDWKIQFVCCFYQTLADDKVVVAGIGSRDEGRTVYFRTHRFGANLAFNENGGQFVEAKLFHQLFFSCKVHVTFDVFIGAEAAACCVSQCQERNSESVDV